MIKKCFQYINFANKSLKEKSIKDNYFKTSSIYQLIFNKSVQDKDNIIKLYKKISKVSYLNNLLLLSSIKLQPL